MPRTPVYGARPAVGGGSSTLRVGARGGPSQTELAVGRIVGLLAMATGVGLLAPLAIVAGRDEAEGVMTIVVAAISAVTILAGLVLVLSGRGSGGGSN